VMMGTAFEADELDQKAGEKQHAPSRPHRSAPSARQSAERTWHLCQRPTASPQCGVAGPR
jgi:hypothetical protein